MNRIYKFLSICLLSILVSCGDGFLEIKPLSIYTPESVYIDETGFEGMLVTLRKKLRNDFYGATEGLASETIASDLAVIASKDPTAARNFDIQVLPTSTGVFDFLKIWQTAYEQIRNANVVLSRIVDVEFKSEDIKNTIVAEAYFHRAYWYYRLVHLFGDVPFVNVEHTTPKIDFYTHSRKTVLSKIAQDMDYAVKWLPDAVKPGAVSKGAGYHLLTKIYLANCNFKEAVNAATSVIENGNYSLMKDRFGVDASNASYDVIWDLHQKENKSSEQNKEVLLVVQDKYGFPDAEVNGGTKSMRRHLPAWWQTYIKDPDGNRGMIDTAGDEYFVKLGRGSGYVRSSNYYNYDIWTDETDMRHDSVNNWFPVEKFVYNNPNSNYYGQKVQIQYTNQDDTIHCWYPFPYYKVYIEDEETPDIPQGGHSDWYVFRLAETYLLRAEAYFWLNDLNNAAKDINEVRLRAKAKPVAPQQVNIDYILDERARELYAEELRKTELTRISYIMAENGLYGYSLESFSQKNYWYDRVIEKNNFYRDNLWYGNQNYKVSPFHVLWPIPAKAIDSNIGGVINQNEGYVGTDKNRAPLTSIDNEQ